MTTSQLNLDLGDSLQNHCDSYHMPQQLLGVCGTSFGLARLACSVASYNQGHLQILLHLKSAQWGNLAAMLQCLAWHKLCAFKIQVDLFKFGYLL